ncbi:uncharacterized protein BDR25DRAFT_363833 [Lindgomyces ingoldianus]|uniref:Uncharacterized protein n=1 Tax=Lindgomyces ingoldianus TaxID=673940 RepID=A0ACB6Q6P8_9PLEO|nr:uncharacterized protein BDR25DRAFT_363833 [Lindgomyces ingoldianus]KAF2462614.1 hypothetical protein BDR25DRAFT_363833 [Lindgomyces ingoldianus]
MGMISRETRATHTCHSDIQSNLWGQSDNKMISIFPVFPLYPWVLHVILGESPYSRRVHISGKDRVASNLTRDFRSRPSLSPRYFEFILVAFHARAWPIMERAGLQNLNTYCIQTSMCNAIQFRGTCVVSLDACIGISRKSWPPNGIQINEVESLKFMGAPEARGTGLIAKGGQEQGCKYLAKLYTSRSVLKQPTNPSRRSGNHALAIFTVATPPESSAVHPPLAFAALATLKFAPDYSRLCLQRCNNTFCIALALNSIFNPDSAINTLLLSASLSSTTITAAEDALSSMLPPNTTFPYLLSLTM